MPYAPEGLKRNSSTSRLNWNSKQVRLNGPTGIFSMMTSREGQKAVQVGHSSVD